jgi:hypothetical protein
MAVRTGKASALGVLAREQWRAEGLESERAEALHHLDEHRALLDEIAAGHLRLSQAVSVFRQHIESRGLAAHLLDGYPGRTDEERYARALIDHLKKEFGQDVAKNVVVRRLEAELQNAPTLPLHAAGPANSWNRPAGPTQPSRLGQGAGQVPVSGQAGAGAVEAQAL